MALYTYDEQVDVLYVLRAPEPEASIGRTVELGERLHVDMAPDGSIVGVEILYPKNGAVDLEPLKNDTNWKSRSHSILRPDMKLFGGPHFDH